MAEVENGRNVLDALGDQAVSDNSVKRILKMIAPQGIVALTVDDLLRREFPPMEPLLGPWLRKQNLAMVYSWRGVGKTHFALGVAYAVATGGTFLKWKAEKPRKVLYIDGEMPGETMKRRLASIVEAQNTKPPEGFFRIVTPDVQQDILPDLGTLRGQMAFAPLIEDAELIVVDNLSSLVRSGVESEGESWVGMAGWALAMRREGRAVLFVHHEGKNGSQRGASRREDILDVVLRLKRPKGYTPDRGAQFEVRFEKARGLLGDDVREIEATLSASPGGRTAWTFRDADAATDERAVELLKAGMSDIDIAKELGINRTTAWRARKKAEEDGLL